MVADPMCWEKRLTGQTRYRLTFFGKVVLQVEVAHHARRMNPFAKVVTGGAAVYTTWRDATMADLRFDLDAIAPPESRNVSGDTMPSPKTGGD